MSLPIVAVSPTTAAQAYSKVASGVGDDGGFGAVLERAVGGVVEAGHQADAQAVTAIKGGGNYTDVVTAVSHAELALQSAVAIRDKVVQAYQDVMKMPI